MKSGDNLGPLGFFKLVLESETGKKKYLPVVQKECLGWVYTLFIEVR